MKLIIISPETAHESEIAVYQRALTEPNISHIHLRRKKALTNLEWNRYRPFSSKIIFSKTCGVPPFHCIGMHGSTSLISTSKHTIDEANNCTTQFCYISPIYPSISKKGHQNEALLPALKNLENIPNNWVALGGIQPDNMFELKSIGFKNVAVLGFIWTHPNPMTALDILLDTL
tara:strand:+ start:216696 stop:217217 length:522 start_codon:yes stop_codon:yes gene_type:complete